MSRSTGWVGVARPSRGRTVMGRTVPRLVLAAGLAAWLAVGVLGLWRYIDGYVVYRGFPPPVTPAGIAAGRTEQFHFYSPSLHRESTALVYVPPGYQQVVARGQRFGVLYLLHGSPGVAANIFNAGAAGRDANVLIHRHRIAPMLMVAPYGLQGLGGDTEWVNSSVGRYERYVVDAVHAVDASFATRADRAHRVLAGDSEGAYGAANIALHNLPLFGGFESWSGYFSQPGYGALAGAGSATLAANSPTAYLPRLVPAIHRSGLHAFLYAGSGDGHGMAQIRRFAPELRAAGVTVRTGAYPGGHDWGLWRREMARTLALASRWMSHPGGQGNVP